MDGLVFGVSKDGSPCSLGTTDETGEVPAEHRRSPSEIASGFGHIPAKVTIAPASSVSPAGLSWRCGKLAGRMA